MKNKSAYLFVLVSLLPVLIFRDYTPSNELRYLSIADEALRNGNFFAFTNHGIPYADKPPFYFWIVMLGKVLFGQHHMWFLSLFSVIPTFILVNTMDKWIEGSMDEKWRETGRWMLLSCGLFLGSAIVLRMDMLMCMFITLSLYTFYQMLTSPDCPKSYSTLFPVYVFMGFFTKGPVGILVPLISTLTYLACTKRIRLFKKFWGWKTWGILLAGCIIWFGCVYLEGGYSYLDNLLFHQTIDRAVNSFHHKEPFYYYGIAIWYSLFPWSFLIIAGLVVTLIKKGQRTDLGMFFLTVAGTTFIFLSCVSSKIAIYLLPTFSFFTYLALFPLSRWKWKQWLALSVAFPAFVFAVAGPVLYIISRQGENAYLGQPFFYAAGILLSIMGIYSLYLLYKKKNINKAINTIAIGLFAAVFVGGWSVPKINDYMGYGGLCKKAMEIAKEKDISTFYEWEVSRPENMDVYLGQPINEASFESIASDSLKNSILMVPKKKIIRIADFIEGKETHQVGKIFIIVF